MKRIITGLFLIISLASFGQRFDDLTLVDTANGLDQMYIKKKGVTNVRRIELSHIKNYVLKNAGFDTTAIGVDSLSKLFWNINGNAGTDTATNFIGTTDGENLVVQPNSGNVGVGTTTPTTKLQVFNGSISLTDGSINIVEISNDGGSGLITVTDGANTSTIQQNAVTTKEIVVNQSSSYVTRITNPNNENERVQYLADTDGVFAMSINGVFADINGNVNLYEFDSIKIVDGTQANGYVLTSDANGLATWQSLLEADYSALPQYANNAAAISAGRAVGKLYVDNSWNLLVVH